jgi:hypothetical protein
MGAVSNPSFTLILSVSLSRCVMPSGSLVPQWWADAFSNLESDRKFGNPIKKHRNTDGFIGHGPQQSALY